MHITPFITGMAVFIAGTVAAQSFEQSEKLEQFIIEEAQASQAVVTTSADQALELQAEIEALQAEIEELEVYHQHLERLIDNQGQEQLSLNTQLNNITETRHSIVPLMYHMLDWLEHYIEQDMPIKKTLRTARVDTLRELMAQANISDAEKYRRIVEAYQIEMDYTSKLGVYIDTIEVGGVVREVEQLNLGRVTLIARSPDQQQYWAWNTKQQRWQVMDKQFTTELEKAFLVANKRASPDILRLPLSITEVSQ